MADFTYEKLKLNKDNPEKWFVSYTIKYRHPFGYRNKTGKDSTPKKVHYIKLYGGEYLVKLNDYISDAAREVTGDNLLRWVEKDLKKGIDPRLKGAILEGELYQEIERAKGVTYDEAYKIMVDYHNWDSPAESQKLTARNNKIWFNAQFRRFVEELGKTDDVTKITSEDLTKIIVKQNTEGSWSISTCITKLGNMGFMFTALVEKGKMVSSPTFGLKAIKKKLKRTVPQKPKANRFEIWTQKEIDNFNKIGNCDKYLYDYTLGLTCYYAFIRRSEMLRLKLGMLDLVNNRFCIPSDITKSANKYDSVTTLYVKIDPKLMTALLKFIDVRFGEDQNPDYFLFSSIRRFDLPYDYYQYDKDYRLRLGKALDNGKANYSLKHTGVTHLWYDQSKKGVSPTRILAKLQKLCRHSSIFQTMTYLSNDLGIDIDIDEREED
jgi:integrase